MKTRTYAAGTNPAIAILIEGRMKYQDNRGKICSVPGCNNIARVKGLCMECYGKRKKEKKGE